MIINNSHQTGHYLWTKRSKMQQVVTACWLNSTVTMRLSCVNSTVEHQYIQDVVDKSQNCSRMLTHDPVTSCWIIREQHCSQCCSEGAAQHCSGLSAQCCSHLLTGFNRLCVLRMYAGLENCGQRLYISYPSRCWQRNFNPLLMNPRKFYL